MKVLKGFQKGELPWNKGKETSRETRDKISQSKLGTKNHNYRRDFSLETRTKMSERAKARLGIIAPNWKGNLAGYRALHIWINKQRGKAIHCELDKDHKSTRYHLANISKEYKRDLSDWMQMCPSCNCLDRVGRRVSA